MRMTSVDRDRILEARFGEVNRKTVLLNVSKERQDIDRQNKWHQYSNLKRSFGEGDSRATPVLWISGKPPIRRKSGSEKHEHIHYQGEDIVLHSYSLHGDLRPLPYLSELHVVSSYRSATPFLSFETHQAGWVPHHIRSDLCSPGGFAPKGGRGPWCPCPSERCAR